jgi:hypothetical protein
MGFVQGAARILVAPISVAYPDGLDDIINMTAGATLYDPVGPWEDVGFTKTGINITRNNAEETFTVDQIRSAIRTRPSNWEMSVGTQLAEASLETFALAWELPDACDRHQDGTRRWSELQVGMGAPTELPGAAHGCAVPVPARAKRRGQRRLRCTSSRSEPGSSGAASTRRRRAGSRSRTRASRSACRGGSTAWRTAPCRSVSSSGTSSSRFLTR